MPQWAVWVNMAFNGAQLGLLLVICWRLRDVARDLRRIGGGEASVRVHEEP